MSTTNEPLQNTNSNFIGLQSYTEEQANIFFGRDEEINRLTKLVESNVLTIVFGKSGTGKTSLLNAGVFPKLRKDYCLPFRIRLEFQEDSPDLVTQIKNVLRSEIDKYGFKVEAYPTKETLWEYFHSEPLWKSITPILIFDQFEEIFTLAKRSNRFGNEELNSFWEELSDLVENSIPEKLKSKFLNHKEQIEYSYKSHKIKIMFAFREEFLPEFENITSKIPSIKYSRFRLMPMNGNQAYEVITKTWKDNIDTAQAHEIVTFLTNETDKTSYDLITIEPSLLSQVCSYIDKERIIEGSQKISSDFLKKYPKATILRSIYNEVLDESNNAIPATALDLNTNINPVKVFAEDKLITDEGYRTKYVLNENDAMLLPAVEVLKQKYFLRDDGKSLELTHDVLAPLIKDDREERRKQIALATARKKANRRALVIVIFSIIAAGLIWYLVTRKAISDRENAISQTIQLKKQISHDSLKLANIGDSIKKRSETLVVQNKNKINGSESGSISESSFAAIIQQSQNDSNHLELLKKQYSDLINKKTELENTIVLQNGQFTAFRSNQNKLDSTINAIKKYIDYLREKIFTDSSKYVLLQQNFDKLKKEFYDYKLKNPEQYKPVAEVEKDTNSLRLNLYYGSAKDHIKAPGNLKIYLIPYSDVNKTIIKNAMLYEIRCDEMNLDKAKNKRIAKYINGHYSFAEVPAGKYLIKICDYYGGYYTYTKKTNDTVSLTWNASPPIR